MYKNKTVLALIPARGGSKGVPHKNIKTLYGKPLIAWSIEQALCNRYIDRIIVSSDNRNIIKTAKKFGAEAPFVRPKILSSDTARSMDMIMHALDWLRKKGIKYDLLLLLQPTSPLRRKQDIDNAIRMLFSKHAKAIISVSEVRHHPYWENTLPKDGCLNNFVRKGIVNKNRQELPVFYRVNGAIYLAYSDYLRKYRDFLGKGSYAYIMPVERSVDIDTLFDFRICDYLLRKNEK